MSGALLLTGLLRRPRLLSALQPPRCLCARSSWDAKLRAWERQGVGKRKGREASAQGLSSQGTFLLQSSSPRWATSALRHRSTLPDARGRAGRQRPPPG